MLHFFTRKSPGEPFPFHLLETDMHSHLIPNVDDGAPDTGESLSLIQGMLDLGYSKLITTPHVMRDMYPNDEKSLGVGYEALKKAWPGELPLRFAAEYFLDDHLNGLLERNQPLLTVSNSLVLFELSFVSVPMGLKDTIFNLQMNRYDPILAHPERYTYFHRNPAVYAELHDSGCKFQCNILSFTGYYGEAIRDAAEYLVSKDLVEYLGTDLHHQRHLKALREMTLTPALKKLINSPLHNPKL